MHWIVECDKCGESFNTNELGKTCCDKEECIKFEKIKEFAENQLFLQNEGIDDLVCFGHEEFCIVNPWYDCTARRDLTNKQAIELYGNENVELFIKKVHDRLFN